MLLWHGRRSSALPSSSFKGAPFGPPREVLHMSNSSLPSILSELARPGCEHSQSSMSFYSSQVVWEAETNVGACLFLPRSFLPQQEATLMHPQQDPGVLCQQWAYVSATKQELSWLKPH